MNLLYPIPFWICLGLALLGGVLAWRVRARIGKSAGTLMVAGMILLALAAGSLRVKTDASQPATVLIDLSDSTRTADYRDPAKLDAMLRRMLGHQFEVGSLPFKKFGEEGPPQVSTPAVLFSDGRFGSWTPGVPVYPVLDPAIGRTDDARIVEIRRERGDALVIIENLGAARVALVDGRGVEIPAGRSRVVLGPASRSHTIALDQRDAWPENDSAEWLPSPAEAAEPWYVGLSPPSQISRGMAAADLPANPAAYASTSLLAIDAASAAALTPAQQRAIATWVRDMGGGLVLVAGDASWSRLRGGELEPLSPLSVDPPEPAAEWVVLLDFSGSMAGEVSGIPRWRKAMEAAKTLIAVIPRSDGVRVGSFAEKLTWWTAGQAGDLRLSVPADVQARGPTNIEPAIESALAQSPGGNRQLLLMTDAEVELPRLADLTARLKAARVRVSCLLLSDGRGAAALEQLCRGSGGQLLPERDPTRWADAARRLGTNLAASRFNITPVDLKTDTPLPGRTARIAGWNSAWPRSGAQAFAWSGEWVLGARWQVELGQVAALAWMPSANDLQALAYALMQRPANPAYVVQWPSAGDPRVRVTVDLAATPRPSHLELRVAPAGDRSSFTLPLAESAPGEYSVKVDENRGVYLSLVADGITVARGVIPPIYPREFTAIGTDQARLEQLARETGGQVVDGNSPIEIAAKTRWVNLRLAAGLSAIALFSAAIILLRRRV